MEDERVDPSELQVRVLAPSELPLWDDLNESSPEGHFFCSRLWLDLIDRHFGRIRYVGVFEEDRLIAGLSFQEDGSSAKRLNRPRGTPFGGILIHKDRSRPGMRAELDRHVSSALLEFFRDYEEVRFVTTPEFINIRWFIWQGWKARPLFTYRLFRDQEREFYNQLTAHTRNEIEKGQGLGYQVVESRNPDALATLFEPTYGHIFSHDFYVDLVDAIYDRDCGRLFTTVDPQDQIRAAMLIPWDRHRCYGLYTCHNQAKDREAYSLVRWKAINWMWQRGHTVFDWCGANVEQRVPFKEDFSPLLVPFYEVRKE